MKKPATIDMLTSDRDSATDRHEDLLAEGADPSEVGIHEGTVCVMGVPVICFAVWRGKSAGESVERRGVWALIEVPT